MYAEKIKLYGLSAYQRKIEFSLLILAKIVCNTKGPNEFTLKTGIKYFNEWEAQDSTMLTRADAS